MDLTKLVDAGVLGGWVRAGVGALLAAIIARFPGLKEVLDPGTQTAIGVAVSSVVVGYWSHLAKRLAKAGA